MNFREWCPHHFPGGSFSGDSYSCKNVFRGEKNASLSITEHNQKWFDHGTGEGGDVRFLCHEHGIEAWDGVEPWEESREVKDSPSRAEAKKDASSDAVKLWQSGRPAPEDNPYLQRKRIRPNGCREVLIGGERTLIVPAYSEDGHVVGVERIKPGGSKQHLGQKAGAFFLLGAVEAGKPIVLCEGFSTGAAVHESTGYATVVCFGASNIPAIAKRLREQHPGAEIVLAVDNDDAGERAVKDAGAGFLPCVPDGGPHTDWNDVFCLMGTDEARKLFDMKLESARAVRPDVTEEKKLRYELVRIGDIELVEPEYLVNGLIEDKALGQIFGSSGSMKSFLTLDLAACVATGLPFHGRQVKEGPVIYLAGEGFNGIKRRLTAWELNTGVSLKDAPLYISRRAPTLANRESARDVAEAIRGIAETVGNPALICIDTVARATVGADENSNSDMGEFIETIDEIRHEHDCVLLTVHHSGLADKDRGRGASAIHAALDVEYQVVKDGMSVTMLNKKMKDGAEPEPIHFQATEITVGQARNGDAITSVALEEAEEGPRERNKPLTPVQKLALDTLMIASEKAGTLDADGAFVGLHVEDWRPFFYERHTADNTHAKNMAFIRAREKLVECGELSVKNDYYRLNGVSAILEKSIVEKLKESGSHKSQASHMCITCDSSQRKDESHTVTHPFRGVTCDSPVTSENDIESSGKESVEGFIRNETAKRNTEQNRTFAEHVRSEHPVEPNEPNTLSIESVRCSVCVRSENDLPDKKAPVVLEEIPKEVSLPRVEPEPADLVREPDASVPVKPSGKKNRKREEAELERLFKDAEPDECSPSRGIPIDAVPEDVVLPCLVFDGKKDRWLVRVDVLSTGKRLFHTAWSKTGRVTWSFEEPGRAAAS